MSAEKGYLKEAGNILMHFAMVAVLVGLAISAMYGWHGNKLVVAGPDTRFCNVLQQYDEYGLGSRVGTLPNFCFEFRDFEATYTESGMPLSFLAHAEVTEGNGEPRPVDFTVNRPLRLDGTSVYLLGNGYSPVLRYTDRDGRAQTVTVPFLPNDPLGTAEGVASFPDVNRGAASGDDAPSQVVFQGLYLPTAPADGAMLTRSLHPEERHPLLWLFPYQGDVEEAVPESLTVVNDLITAGDLELAATPAFLRPGESLTLDDGTTVEFLGTERWITISVRSDPGQPVLLVSMVVLLGGLMLSLSGRRRRVWFRITPTTTGGSMISAGGLPRSDHPGFDEEFQRLVDALATTRAASADPVSTSRSA